MRGPTTDCAAYARAQSEGYEHGECAQGFGISDCLQMSCGNTMPQAIKRERQCVGNQQLAPIATPAIAMAKGLADTLATATPDDGTWLQITAQVPAANWGRFTLLIGLPVAARRNGCGYTLKR